MKRLLFVLFSFAVFSAIAFGEETLPPEVMDPELSGIILSFLPAGAGEVLMIVFSAIAALNAVSITLEKITKTTKTDKDDKAVGKVRTGLMKAQKVLNFFIAK